MNLFEHERKMMFDDTDVIKDVKICGKTLLGKLDDELRIKLQFVATLIAGQYDAIKVTVINRTEGAVDTEIFKFSDIIGQQNRGALSAVNPHIWVCNDKPDWYIPVTASQKVEMADKILSYVSMYRSQNMGMENEQQMGEMRL